jgi:hypothetical protein
MSLRSGKTTLLILALALLLLAACAPDDLDITPTRTPTSTPVPTPTRTPTPTPNPDAVAEEEQAEPEEEVEVDAPLEQILAAWPAQWNAGAQWRRSRDATTQDNVTYLNVDDGRAFTIYFSESGGSLAEVTIAIFEDDDSAETYYNTVAGRVRTLENAEENAAFPTPNRFGQGTYGQDALLLRDHIVVRVSVPRFSSSAGAQPLVPLMRGALRIVDTVIAPAT